MSEFLEPRRHDVREGSPVVEVVEAGLAVVGGVVGYAALELAVGTLHVYDRLAERFRQAA